MFESMPLWSVYLIMAFISCINILTILGMAAILVFFIGFWVEKIAGEMLEKQLIHFCGPIIRKLKEKWFGKDDNEKAGNVDYKHTMKRFFDNLLNIKEKAEWSMGIMITLFTMIMTAAGLSILYVLNRSLIWLLSYYII